MTAKRRRERTQKYLKRNHGTHIPHEWIVLQTEACEIDIKGKKREKLQRLDMGVAHALRLKGNVWRAWNCLEFTDTLPFWPWLYARIRRNCSLWLIGHGIAKSFTLVNGWNEIQRRVLRLTKPAKDSISQPKAELEEYELQDGWLVDGDPPTILQLYHDFGVIHIVDIRNYSNASVAEFAQELGTQAPERPGDKRNGEPWFTYLGKQCQIISDWLLDWLLYWRDNDLGQWRHTIASLAMAAYRHRFMDAKLLIHTCEFALEKEREALAGGEIRNYFCGSIHPLKGKSADKDPPRVTQHTLYGKTRVHVLDVNSLYPYVMKNEWMPAELCAWKRPGDIDDYAAWSKELLLIGRVMVQSYDEPYPFLGDGQRYWACGTFWTTLCGPELARAVQMNHIVKWDGLCAYLKRKCFWKYVDHFHRERLLAVAGKRKLRATQCKLLMNSLAGKFGQRHQRWDFVDFKDPPVHWGTFPVKNADSQRMKIYRAIAGYVQEQQVTTEGLDSMPAIEAFVNAHGREHMRTLRKTALERNVFYQSTDTLHVSDEGRALLQPHVETYAGELGKLREEGTYQSAIYRGPHDYTLDGHHVVAGLQFDAEFDERGRYSQWQEQTLKTILTHEPGGFLRVVQVVHQLGNFHPHGILHEDGEVTPPIVLDGQLWKGPVAKLPRRIVELGTRMRFAP